MEVQHATGNGEVDLNLFDKISSQPECSED